jgi:CMP/dCMP kinase
MFTVVLAISRQLGSGGSYIGRKVADDLRLKYVDREILEEAARQLGREDREVAGLEERVATVWTAAARVFSAGTPDVLYVSPPLPPVYEEDVFTVESQIIRQIATTESAVIVGRGGSHILRDHPGLISVFVHAPEAWRIERVRATHHVADPAGIVADSDRQRARFLRSLNGLEWTDTTRYHLSVNTAAVGLENAGKLVADLVAARLEAIRGAEPAR